VSTARDSDLWWKNAVIYCLDIETYLDSDGDGIGDLAGLIRRIDYLAGMGVSCIWLMPFHPSPNRDDGYDITDYYAVDDRLGTLGDFVVLVRAAKDRGLRVLIDLVVNHTSDRHPWFRSARASRNSRFRDFYVWRDEPPATPKADVVFPDAEQSIWAWDEKAGQYYLHHFYSHQPDLNIANPAVREEIARIVGFWLQLGIDGFRVDAVPFLLETGGIADAPDLDPHVLLKEIRSVVSRRNGEAMLLGEVNLKPKDLVTYFGDDPGDEIQLLFDFNVMQAMYLSLARCDASPLIAQLESLPPIPEQCQWANFLRNHDELTLDKLTDRQRQEVFDEFGPDEDMQLFGRGLRRRLPSMFGGDQARLRMAYSLMFSLPGAPVLFYGEEIGMGENLDIPGRVSVRTPMQWSAQPNGGFSTAAPSRLRRPLPTGRFGPLGINVEEQRRDGDSLLNWMERLIRRRRETPELGWGEMTILDTGCPSVIAHMVAGEGRSILLVHNLAPEPCEVRLHVPIARDVAPPEIIDLMHAGNDLELGPRGKVEFVSSAYGHHWFTIEDRGHQRAP
jgi:trehalose synthase